MARHSHKDVEFSVSWGHHEERVYKSPKEATSAVVVGCMSRGEATLDILVYSEAGARSYGGDDAVEQYREDPEASVFERFEFKCNAVGRVP